MTIIKRNVCSLPNEGDNVLQKSNFIIRNAESLTGVFITKHTKASEQFLAKRNCFALIFKYFASEFSCFTPSWGQSFEKPFKSSRQSFPDWLESWNYFRLKLFITKTILSGCFCFMCVWMAFDFDFLGVTGN